MRKARIVNGFVAEILDLEPFPPFAPDFIWVECPDLNIRDGDVYRDGVFMKYKDSLTDEELIAQLKSERDERLQLTDWYIVREMDSGTPTPEPIKVYRQALRNISTLDGFPRNFTWPTINW
jgi:hypothetical protein